MNSSEILLCHNLRYWNFLMYFVCFVLSYFVHNTTDIRNGWGSFWAFTVYYYKIIFTSIKTSNGDMRHMAIISFSSNYKQIKETDDIMIWRRGQKLMVKNIQLPPCWLPMIDKFSPCSIILFKIWHAHWNFIIRMTSIANTVRVYNVHWLLVYDGNLVWCMFDIYVKYKNCPLHNISNKLCLVLMCTSIYKMFFICHF